MAKSKKITSNSMVLVGKGSYTVGKEKPIRKGQSITKGEYEALDNVSKALFTDPKTASEVLKTPVVEVAEETDDETDDETEQGSQE